MRDRAGAISLIKKGAVVDKTRNCGLIGLRAGPTALT